MDSLPQSVNRLYVYLWLRTSPTPGGSKTGLACGAGCYLSWANDPRGKFPAVRHPAYLVHMAVWAAQVALV
jgi:hypothetical protein